MKRKLLLLVDLFERFIKESKTAKRLKPDGTRIKARSIVNYEYALKYIREYQLLKDIKLRIAECTSRNKKNFFAESNYWKNFYLGFTNFLYKDKYCFDNYVGSMIKIIKTFFNYLNKEKGIETGPFFKSFYVCKQEIPVICLSPLQLQFLINDLEFHESLSAALKKTKLIFIFGCTLGLRYSDLFKIRIEDLETSGQNQYLRIISQKTQKELRIKLPFYATQILNYFILVMKKRKTIFPPIPISRFNLRIKEICRLAGWKQSISKVRTQRGIMNFKKDDKNISLFCDNVSSHTMRRTAITTMLMLGMKELVVKQVTGHAANSKSFGRYINYAQSFLDTEMDNVFNQERFDLKI
jgi:integrase